MSEPLAKCCPGMQFQELASKTLPKEETSQVALCFDLRAKTGSTLNNFRAMCHF